MPDSKYNAQMNANDTTTYTNTKTGDILTILHNGPWAEGAEYLHKEDAELNRPAHNIPVKHANEIISMWSDLGQLSAA
jgi:hypothetical protein